MKNKTLVVGLLAAFVLLLVGAGLATAADPPQGDIALSVDGATRPLKVKFDHEKHKSYECKECHHIYKPDDKGEYPKDKKGDYETKPENTWTQDGETQKCADCHKLEADKKKKKEMLVSKNGVRSLEDAFHDNCVACHKDYNKEKKLKGDDATPSKCNDCHEKK